MVSECGFIVKLELGHTEIYTPYSCLAVFFHFSI
jgi:hypothetical protein